MSSMAAVATFSGSRRNAEHDSGRTTVLGDHDAAMLAFEAVDHLGEAVWLAFPVAQPGILGA
jgi:hypothetical protein